jgi:predicted phage terminase large subunit-like protein
MREAVKNPVGTIRSLNNHSLYEFIQYFWNVINYDKFSPNWHIDFLCDELEQVAQGVADRQPRKHDLVVNIPPGTSKSMTISIFFPAWCWTKWPWMRFVTASYSSQLSLEAADKCRNLIQSQEFQEIYPDIGIKEDQNTKSNFKIVKRVAGLNPRRGKGEIVGGGRFTTSVGGTIMGFHGDINIVDDPLNPKQAASDTLLDIANQWMELTLPSRKVNKEITVTILVMQRLHQDDPAGHLLAKQKENIRHICLPGEIRNYRKQLNPPELADKYIDDLLDPKRLSWKALADMEADLGQYGYAGQIGQDPTPPGGGMFKIDRINIVNEMPKANQIIKTVRAWDKAGTADGGAYTVGVKMSQLVGNKWFVEDVKRGRWASEERERIIKQVAELDGVDVEIWIEQEPGSSGKDGADGTIRNLAGFVCRADRPTGDKITRADPFSVQVNNGGLYVMNNPLWTKDYLEELRFFPFSTYKDQTDASSLAFKWLVSKKMACRIT